MLYSHLLAIISGAYELVNDRTVAIRFEVVRLLASASQGHRESGEKLSCVKRAKIYKAWQLINGV